MRTKSPHVPLQTLGVTVFRSYPFSRKPKENCPFPSFFHLRIRPLEKMTSSEINPFKTNQLTKRNGQVFLCCLTQPIQENSPFSRRFITLLLSLKILEGQHQQRHRPGVHHALGQLLGVLRLSRFGPSAGEASYPSWICRTCASTVQKGWTPEEVAVEKHTAYGCIWVSKFGGLCRAHRLLGVQLGKWNCSWCLSRNPCCTLRNQKETRPSTWSKDGLPSPPPFFKQCFCEPRNGRWRNEWVPCLWGNCGASRHVPQPPTCLAQRAGNTKTVPKPKGPRNTRLVCSEIKRSKGRLRGSEPTPPLSSLPSA